jgi:hypothetical protein
MTDAADTEPLPRSFVRTAARRIAGMAAVWAGFGVLNGIISPPGTGLIAVVAGVIASCRQRPCTRSG